MGAFFQKGPSNGHTLLLTAGEQDAALSYFGIDPVGQGGHKVGEIGAVKRAGDVLVRGVRVAEQDIFPNGARKQKVVLKDHSDMRAQGLQRIVADVPAVNPDCSFRHVVEARQQADQRALAAAGVAHQSQSFANLHIQIDIPQHGAAAGRKRPTFSKVMPERTERSSSAPSRS